METVVSQEPHASTETDKTFLVGFLIPPPYWATIYRYWSEGKFPSPCYVRFNNYWGCDEIWIQNNDLSNLTWAEEFELFTYEYMTPRDQEPFAKGNRKRYELFPNIDD